MTQAALHSVKGVAILLWATSPQAPTLAATPFYQAMAAAAMDYTVEVYFAAGSVQLLKLGVADQLRAADVAKTIGDTMREARAAGATFWVCSDALAANGLAFADLDPVTEGHGGAVQFMVRATDPAWRALVF
jgi:uncharacterized protein